VVISKEEEPDLKQGDDLRQVLEAGSKEWNAWRKQQENQVLDLSGMDLSEMDLTGFNLAELGPTGRRRPLICNT
jgi:hypothetical protein